MVLGGTAPRGYGFPPGRRLAARRLGERGAVGAERYGSSPTGAVEPSVLGANAGGRSVVRFLSVFLAGFAGLPGRVKMLEDRGVVR